MSFGWVLWGCMLVYINLQDILHHAFSLWTVVMLGSITLYLNPLSWSSMLGYFLGFCILKYGVEWWKRKAYIGIGDVEILSILSSQIESVEWLFMISGCLGILYCTLFQRNGLPFVPVMTTAWCIIKILTYMW